VQYIRDGVPFGMQKILSLMWEQWPCNYLDLIFMTIDLYLQPLTEYTTQKLNLLLLCPLSDLSQNGHWLTNGYTWDNYRIMHINVDDVDQSTFNHRKDCPKQ
jgi:hypothetical protein